MIRERVLSMRPTRDHGFRWRSQEVSRLEGLSDAVFGFAITLLVVSLEVPRTYGELTAMYSLAHFVAFAVCFALIALLWYDHHVFFRRYGLDDTRTTLLNMVLLFVVLFYVYPLKFLFTIITAIFLARAGLAPLEPQVRDALRPQDWPGVMILYGVGAALVYGCLLLLYRHAYRQREQLGLDEVERLETRFSMIDHGIMLSIALLSLAVAVWSATLPPRLRGLGGLAGMVYMLIAPAQTLQGTMRGRARRKLDERLARERAGSGAHPIGGGGTLPSAVATVDPPDGPPPWSGADASRATTS